MSDRTPPEHEDKPEYHQNNDSDEQYSIKYCEINFCLKGEGCQSYAYDGSDGHRRQHDLVFVDRRYNTQ